MAEVAAYQQIQLIGKGSQGNVFRAYDTKEQHDVAIKVLSSKENPFGEITVLKHLQRVHSQHSTNLRNVVLKDKEIWVVMDLADGEELHAHLMRDAMSENEAKIIFKQLLIAVKEIHDNNICHLDLKLENIMYHEAQNRITLVDFGFSAFTHDKAGLPRKIESYCGSLHYAAPEVINHIPFDGRKVDVWALGVLLFALLARRFPFADQEDDPSDHDLIMNQICFAAVQWPKEFSPSVVSFLHTIFRVNPAKRPSVDQLLTHPWLNSLNY